jgi:putative ABC transport system permease protein
MYHALFYSQQTPGQALRLVVRNKISLAQPLPVADEDKIRHIPGVKEISVWNWFGGTYKDNRDPNNFFARLGVEPGPFLKIRTQMEMPADQRQAFLTDKTACVISRDLADKLGFHIGDRITLVGDIYPVSLETKVVGIFDDPDAQQSMFFNWKYLSDMLPVGRRSYISTLAILANSTDDVPRIAQAVDAMTHESSYPTKTESEAQFALSFVSFLGNIKLFLMSICAAVTFTILLVSGNTMAMSVRERIREVGVMKTLGFTNGKILTIIVTEAVAIAVIGGAIGLLFAEFLTVVVGRAAAVFFPQLRGLTIDFVTALIALAIAALIGVISSIVPASNAARTNILDSLRYAG